MNKGEVVPWSPMTNAGEVDPTSTESVAHGVEDAIPTNIFWRFAPDADAPDSP